MTLPNLLTKLRLTCASTFAYYVAEPRFIENAIRAPGSAVRWAQDIEKHENRRMMSITNTRERGQAFPTNVIGNKYNTRRS